MGVPRQMGGISRVSFATYLCIIVTLSQTFLGQHGTNLCTFIPLMNLQIREQLGAPEQPPELSRALEEVY